MFPQNFHPKIFLFLNYDVTGASSQCVIIVVKKERNFYMLQKHPKPEYVVREKYFTM